MMTSNLKKCPLFNGVEENEIKPLLDCLRAVNRNYQKDEFIFRADNKAESVGIVLSGGAYVIQEDFWGNRAILSHVSPGGLFAEAFSCAQTERLPVSVIAAEKSEILLIDYRKIVTVCSAACVFHSRLIANMVTVLADNNIKLTRKLEYISKRTTREKILSFLSAQAIEAKSRAVTVPFNRQQLADYLCVERSALSRELSKMQNEGLLKFVKNNFFLSKNIPEH